jgi:RNA polymerase sigma-70 factor (ECF subfamily)
MLDREQELDAAIAQAREAWPALTPVDAAVFRAWVRDRVPEDVALATVPINDLYLACACAAGDPQALATFEGHFLREVAIACAKLRAPSGVLDEALQVVRDRLFVRRASGVPGIASYAGRGDLRGWVRVIAMREVIKLCDRDQREVTTGDEALLDALSPSDDPELEHLKAHYHEHFARAFRAAIQGLTPRERTLLRYQVIDGLGVEAIGKIHKVHHATAARWLVRARDALLDGTKQRLSEMLRLSADEVDSVLRLIQSRMNVSIERLLKK